MKNVISVDTCIEIYNAHREIEAAENLIAEIDAKKDEWSRNTGDYLPRGNGPFDSERRVLALTSSTFSSSKTIANVSPKLARYIIVAHAEEARGKLSDACLKARMELDGIIPAPSQIEERSDTGTAEQPGACLTHKSTSGASNDT